LAIASSGCGDGSRNGNTNVTGPPSTGGATFATGGATSSSVSAGGVPSTVMTAGGGTPTGSTASTGGTTANASGGVPVGAGGAATSSTGGATNASGGTAGTAGSGGSAGATAGSLTAPFPNLAVFGNTTTLELAPVLLAAKSVYPGKATVANGGIPNLWSGADLATNAETQA